MRVPSTVLALAILAAGCGAPATTSLSESHAAAMEDSVASFLSTWSEGAQQGGWDRIVERYADDPRFLWVEDGRVRYGSHQELRAGFETVEASFSGARTEFTEPTITPLAPGLAHVAARFRTTLSREDGPEVSFGGAMTMTVTHADHGWKVLQGHTSSERERQRGAGSDGQ